MIVMFSYNANATHTAQMSVGKITTTKGLTKAYTHNNRIGEKQANNIDMRREELNQVLVNNCKTDSFMLDILNRVTGEDYELSDIENIDKDHLYYVDGKKIKKNAVLAGECKSGYPGDLKWVELDKDGNIVDIPDQNKPDADAGHFLYPADEEEFKQWQARTISFIEDRFGKENLLQVQCHMDEAVPHIHAIFVPTYKDEQDIERLAFARFINGPKELAQLQTEYANALSDMNYVRGKEWSANKGHVNGMTATKARALMQRSFDEVPTPTDKTIIQEALDSHDWRKKNEVLQQISNNEELLHEYAEKMSVERTMSNVYAEQIDADGNRLSKERQENDKLKRQIREMEMSQARERDKHQQELLTLQMAIKREECKKKGMEIYSDQKLVSDISQIETIWMENGRNWYVEHGIDMEYEEERTQGEH